MKKLTEEQRLGLKMALEAKSAECARLIKRLNSAEGLGSLPASEKTGEYAGCVLVARLLEISHDIDAGYLPKLDEYVSDYMKAANEARAEATRGFFRHKAAAYHTFLRTCLEEAYTSIGLITPEDAFLVRFRAVQDVQG